MMITGLKLQTASLRLDVGFALGLKVLIGPRWCGKFCRLRSLGRGRQGADRKKEREQGRERGAVSRRRPCQFSAVPGLKSARRLRANGLEVA
ncbi:hypothetical protein INR49_023132 [Caranx melampygus]|nr:hypothetical protein INR49_023132 [Caranx melampygus]